MKKRAISLLLVLGMVFTWQPTEVLAADAPGDFTIENGVLTKYTGVGGDVVIPDGVTEIGEDAFAECSDLASVVIPEDVTSIGVRAFMGCAGLTGIALPDSVTSIGGGAFVDCTGLKEITIPDGVTRIEDNVFMCCGGLTSVALPDSVTSIGHGAFGDCASLTNITLPDNLTTIEDAAFYGCAALTDIMIPRGVTSIGSTAFEECGLSAFTVAAENQAYKAVDGVLFNKAGTELLHYPPRKGGNKYTVPTGVTSIGPGAFANCSGLTEITLPDNLMNIGDGAFSLCGDLIDIKIPDSVTSIGFGAFQGCSSLTEVTVPESVESIGDFAFCDCDNLTGVTILNPAVEFADSYWVFGYPITAVIYGYAGSTAETYCETHIGMYESTFISLGDAPAPAKALTDSMVSLPDGYGATYDKTAHTPVVTVKDGDKTLILDTDYTVAYENNTNAGKATVTVRGKGNYKGSVTKTFIISPVALTGTVALVLTGDNDGDGQADAGDMVALEMKDGKELVIENGAIKLKDGDTTITVAVVWLRAGKTIEGANGLSYTITKADQGKSVAAQISPQDTNNYTGTLTATVSVPAEKSDQPSNSSGGGSTGSSSGSVTNKYAISTAKTSNGSVSLNTKTAKRGEVVTVTVKPDEGYVLKILAVVDGKGKSVSITDVGDGTYTFTMPGTTVTVTPTFEKETPPAEMPTERLPEEKPGISVTVQFSDVKEKDWFCDAVQYVFDRGIMSGLTSDSFGPDTYTSRAMVVTMLYRMEGQPETSGGNFSDVDANKYYSNAVAWASTNGIITGFKDGTFRPNEAVTREQLAVMLYRYGNYKEQDTTKRSDLSRFIDVEQAGKYALDALSWANAVGLISGTDWGGLHPGGSATRAETAAIFMRYCEK